MKISKVIRFADEFKPNILSTELKIQFINECEGIVQSDVMERASDDIVVYDESNLEDELIVRPPHDKIYVAYLAAMIDYANNEYNKYANTIAVFRAYMAEYHSWYFKQKENGGIA